MTYSAVTTSPAAGKRKADLIDLADMENVDPQLSAKRSKAAKGGLKDGSIVKPTNYVLKTTPPKPFSASSSPAPVLSTTTPRRTLQPKSPAARLSTSTVSRPSPLSAPAGRSPIRGKHSGVLSSRRRSARVDPPRFSLGGAPGDAPFSLDAALKGTIPSYASRSSAKPAPRSKSSLASPAPETKASWFFEIHEDTAEQEMTNLLQHGTCVLDISSDEESALRARREGREDKENVPPADDASQTPARAQARLRQQPGVDMVVDKERVALGEMKAADFYAQGCDESSVIIVPGDEGEDEQNSKGHESERVAKEDFTVAPELRSLPAPTPEERTEEPASIDAVMAQHGDSAAVLKPIEGSGETFDLWESGSAKDEQETAAAEASS